MAAHTNARDRSRAFPSDTVSFSTRLRAEYRVILVIGAIPFVLLIPALLHLITENPAIVRSMLAKNVIPGPSPGTAHIDPNIGFTTQALGHLDATDILRGVLPWWNPYSGAGLPLAAELQNASFLPFTLLLALHGGLGIELEHALAQATAGIGTYLLLRSLGLSRSASFVGGILFTLNGTFAWFGDDPSLTLTFIPWVLLGVEVAIQQTRQHQRRSWQLLALATALILLAGFPETVYVAMLLAGVYTLLRLSYLAPRDRLGALGKIALGLSAGAMASAIALGPFLEALPREYLGVNAGGALSKAHLPLQGVSQGLLTPYIAGPIFGFRAILPSWTISMWSNVGGFVSIALILVALYGLVTRFDRLSIGLALLVAVLAGRTYGVAPFSTLFNLVPESGRVAVFRYANPSWELALIILATRGLDALITNRTRHRLGILVAAVAAVLAAWLLYAQRTTLQALLDTPQTHAWTLWSLIGAGVVTIAILGALAIRQRHGAILGSILVVNALVLYCIPIAANPRAGTVDHGLLAFVHKHLGDYRVYSLAVFQPNYSAYYHIASVDYNYLPIPSDTAAWINKNLEPGFRQGAEIFNGANLPTATAQPWVATLDLALKSYEAMGVREVIVPNGTNPFQENVDFPPAAGQSTPTQPSLRINAHTTLRATIPMLKESTAALTSVTVITVPHSRARGTMVARICSEHDCASATATLKAGVFDAVLGSPLAHRMAQPVTVRLDWPSLSHPIAVLAGAQAPEGYPMVLDGRSVASTDVVLGVGLSTTNQAQLVYHDNTAAIYQLHRADPIFSVAGAGCTVVAYGLSWARYSCAHTSTLTYRETSFPGWSARLGTEPLTITTADGLFQQVSVPAGTHTVHFQYQPPHAATFETISVVALLAIVVSWFGVNIRRTRARTNLPGQSNILW